MRRGSRLDMLVFRFQHNWETIPRFRAAASGVIALVFALILCSCVGVVSTLTNSVLASVGAGGGGGGIGRGNTGTGKLAASTAFPTYTLPPYASTVVPGVSPIASSQTPPPVPTPVPTATNQPTVTGCGKNCGGGSVTVTASYHPKKWLGGQTGYIDVHTSQPNIDIGFLINYPNSAADQTFEPAGTTDGNGNFSYSVPVPVGEGAGNATVLIFDSAGAPGVPGATLSVPCG